MGTVRHNISGNTRDILAPGKGREASVRHAARGAQKVAVPFPSAWADAWDGYEYAWDARGKSPKSLRTRRTSVLRLAKQFPDKNPEKITRRDIERHITTMRKTLAEQTVFGSYSDLRSFFGWLAKDTRAENIMDQVEKLTAPDPKAVPVLDAAQIKALLGTCKGEGIIALRDRAVMMMLLETGGRRMEVRGLHVSDVNLKESTAWIREGKGSGHGPKPRMTVFGPGTADALRKYIRASKNIREKYWGQGDSPLFLSRYGCQIGYGAIGIMLTRRGRMIGIQNLHAHQFRHTWAHINLKGNLGETNIQTLAGWTTGRQLQRYGKALAVQRAVEAARANPVGRVLTRR